MDFFIVLHSSLFEEKKLKNNNPLLYKLNRYKQNERITKIKIVSVLQCNYKAEIIDVIL